jgi:hypothetical protein
VSVTFEPPVMPVTPPNKRRAATGVRSSYL